MVSLRWPYGMGALELRQGDLTRAKLDAVVNAANPQLAGGGGVDGAIHRAAGHQKLQDACQAIVRERGELPTGQAVATPGFDLPARWIIHTVGPIWCGGGNDEHTLLFSAYMRSLETARDLGAHSVGFPAISCGVYGYPLDLAVPVALGALVAGLQGGLVRLAAMCLHGEDAFATWTRLAARELGPGTRVETP